MHSNKIMVLFLSSGFFFSGMIFQPLKAITLAQLCNRFSQANSIANCFGAAEDQACDEKALDICNRFSQIESIASCVGALAGREYTQEELDVCNRFSQADSVSSCLKNAGRRSSRQRSNREIKELVAILRDILDGNEKTANEKLSRLERKLNTP